MICRGGVFFDFKKRLSQVVMDPWDPGVRFFDDLSESIINFCEGVAVIQNSFGSFVFEDNGLEGVRRLQEHFLSLGKGLKVFVLSIQSNHVLGSLGELQEFSAIELILISDDQYV